MSGAEAAHLLGAVLEAADTALTNTDNLRRLTERLVALMDLLGAHHATLQALVYRRTVDDFRSLLQVGQALGSALWGCTVASHWACTIRSSSRPPSVSSPCHLVLARRSLWRTRNPSATATASCAC